MTTETDVITKVGANVSASWTDAMKTAAALRHEAAINVWCRKNYSDSYSSLNTDVKHIISDIVSSLIALEGIAFNMGVYTLVQEAMSMVNILDEGIKRNFSILLDKENQRFINAA